MSKMKLALATAGLLGLAGQSMAALSTADQDFAHKAAAGGLAEVNFGQLAQSNGASSQVKAFGQKMVSDHGKANQELEQIARTANLTLPTRMNDKDQDLRKQLSALKGAQFDAEYTRNMVRDHQEDVAAFEEEARSGQDPALKAFAQKHLPTLREHLRMAQAAVAAK